MSTLTTNLGVNILMALIIAGVIYTMAKLRNPRVAVIVYGLPFPITAALIATRINIGSSHLIGLLLLTGFLWLAYFFHERLAVHSILSSMLSALAYVGAGYFCQRNLNLGQVNFWIIVGFSILVWLAFKFIKPSQEREGVSKVNPWVKGMIVFIIALPLLQVKEVLEGVVVAFPFSGVFAVNEKRENLHLLARKFSQVSYITILMFMVVIYLLQDKVGFYLSILFGWAILLISLLVILKRKER